MADAAQEGDLIALEGHPGTAPVAEAASRELVGHNLGRR
jgi:hypothetical protein